MFLYAVPTGAVMARLCQDTDQRLVVLVLGDRCSRLLIVDPARQDVLVVGLNAMVRDGCAAGKGEGCEQGDDD